MLPGRRTTKASDASAHRDLFLVSFLILFFEPATIRWFAATVVCLIFFTNVILLACRLLGMSVGLLTASRPRNYIRAVLALSMALALAVYIAYSAWDHQVTVTLGDQQTSPRVVSFGAEYRPADPSRWMIPMWAVAGAVFAALALTFVGLGQVMGRAFDAIPNRVVAYTVDVLGRLTGIAAFAAMSVLELPPTAWFVSRELGWRHHPDRPYADARVAVAARARLLRAVARRAASQPGRRLER